ncbi:MAG: hypothetical protein LBS81_00300 [Endomicrobium sp.]|jgi:hypothetical protein|nr:hypothetical protein [Endomicrobium sp.]
MIRELTYNFEGLIELIIDDNFDLRNFLLYSPFIKELLKPKPIAAPNKAPSHKGVLTIPSVFRTPIIQTPTAAPAKAVPRL